MASHDGAKSVSLVAGAACTNGQVLALATGLAEPTSGTTDVVVGVCGETVAIGDAVPVVLLEGILEVTAGAAITQGQLCVPDATGRVTGVASIATITAGGMSIGTALDAAGAAGDVIRVLANPLTAIA